MKSIQTKLSSYALSIAPALSLILLVIGCGAIDPSGDDEDDILVGSVEEGTDCLARDVMLACSEYTTYGPCTSNWAVKYDSGGTPNGKWGTCLWSSSGGGTCYAYAGESSCLIDMSVTPVDPSNLWSDNCWNHQTNCTTHASDWGYAGGAYHMCAPKSDGTGCYAAGEIDENQ